MVRGLILDLEEQGKLSFSNLAKAHPWAMGRVIFEAGFDLVLNANRGRNNRNGLESMNPDFRHPVPSHAAVHAQASDRSAREPSLL